MAKTVGILTEESFTSVPLETLPLPNPRQFCFRYSILELNTAVKPWAFRWLFEHDDAAQVVYLDPDIQVFAPMSTSLPMRTPPSCSMRSQRPCVGATPKPSAPRTPLQNRRDQRSSSPAKSA